MEALKLAEETGQQVAPPQDDEDKFENTVKVAVPIEQKTSGGKKKKAPAEIILMLGQRKGKKQVTIVYGLDLFGIKLKDAAKAAKRKFATGSSITVVCIFTTFYFYLLIALLLLRLTWLFSRQCSFLTLIF